MRWTLAAGALVLLGWTNTAAVQPALDTRALDEAIWMGQSRIEQQRARFHAPYRVHAGQPPADYLDVVTPFRRVVLAAESRARAGERLFGHRQALEVLEPYPDRLDLVVELTFHPHHTLVGVPAYDVVLMSGGRDVQPREVERLPRYGPRIDGPRLPDAPAAPGHALPLTGATVTASFDMGMLDVEGSATALLVDSGAVIARVAIDFGALR
jgi:hypothetical protein